MSSNKKAKEELIRLYGAECFIDKLHLRIDDKPRVYTGKAQYKRMKQLTYHHIKEKRNGGKATKKNGAILSVENHEWFNKQSAEKQAAMNRAFQEYKRRVDEQREGKTECKVELVDDLNLSLEVKAVFFEPQELFKEEKEKERQERKRRIEDKQRKRELQKLKQEYEDR